MLVNLVSMAVACNVLQSGYLMPIMYPFRCHHVFTESTLFVLEPSFSVTRLLSKQPLNLEALANRGFT